LFRLECLLDCLAGAAASAGEILDVKRDREAGVGVVAEERAIVGDLVGGSELVEDLDVPFAETNL
jgi:hypothetical protein